MSVDSLQGPSGPRDKALRALAGLLPQAWRHAPAPSLRRRLGLLVALAMLPLACAALGLLMVAHQRDEQKTRESTLATARALASTIDAKVAEVGAGLRALGSSPPLLAGDLAEFHAQARSYVLGNGTLTSIAVLDGQGRQIANTAVAFGTALSSEGQPSDFGGRLLEGRLAVSNLFIGPNTGRPLMAVVAPLAARAGGASFLAASMDTEKLSGLLRAAQLPPTWTVALIDGTGRIAARSVRPERFVGETATADLLAAAQQRADGTVDGTTKEGTAVVAVFARAPLSNWLVAIGIPRAELDAPLRRASQWLLLAFLASLLLSVLVAVGLGRGITRSTRQLAGAARSFGRQEPVDLEPLAFREANAVAQALRAAAADRDMAQGLLQASEARLRAVLDSAGDGIVLLDGEARVLSFNPAAGRLFGYDPAVAVGLPYGRLVAAPSDTGSDDIAVRARLRDLDRDVLVGLRSDGSRFAAQVTVSPVDLQAQRLTTVIVRDVSARLAMEEALLRSNLDLQQFAFVASHDLRTPLRSINGFLHLLRDGLQPIMDPTSRDMLDRSLRAIDHMNRLTSDLLAYARMENEGKAFQPLDLGQVLQDALAECASLLDEAGAVVDRGPLPLVMGDATQLAQLLNNLLGNAVKYRGSEPLRIRVTSLRQGADWVVCVDDNGIGIAPEHHARIFDVFKRLHTREHIPGSGIGLAICKRVVQRHGGRLWVESAEGQGASFRFSLPVLPGSFAC